MTAPTDASLAALHRDLGQIWNRLAAADDARTRAKLLMDAADLHHELAQVHQWCRTAPTPYDDGHTIAAAHISAAQLLDALVDVEYIAAGSLTRRHATDNAFEPVAGRVLDRMAATADIRDRAALLAELHAAVVDVVGAWAAEVLQALPYAPGMTGWVHDEPRKVSWRAIVRARWRRIRDAR